MKNSQLFHYTIGSHLPQIIADGRINPSKAFVGTQVTGVWLSTNPLWEEAVVKSVLRDGQRVALSRTEIHELGQGLVRFEVAGGDHVCTWPEFITRSGIGADLARTLEVSGRHRGADPAEWYAALRPIPSDEWVGLALWDADSNEWQSVDLA